MKDQSKTKQVLIQELASLRQRIAELEQSESESKQAEMELRDSEERCRALFDRSLYLVYIIDFEGCFIDANDNALKRFGYTREEIHSLNFASLLSEDQLPLAFKALKEIQETGIHRELMEFRVQRKDGAEVYVETQGATITSNGAPTAILAIARDITDRKRAEEGVSFSEQQLKSYFERAGDAIYVLRADTGRIINCNSQACLDLGYSRDELLKLSATDIEHKLSYREIDTIHNDLNRGNLKTVEGRHKRKDGSVFPVEIRLSSLSPAQPGLLISIARDITDREHAEEALRESEEKYRTILESIEEGYYEVDLAGNFTFFNDAMCRIIGYSREEMVGMNNRQYTEEAHLKKLFKMFNEVYRTGHFAKEFDWRIIRKDGTKRYMELSVSLQKNSTGKAIGFYGICRDITERKQAEAEKEKLEAQHRQLQKSESLGRMAAAIAHHFNNQLGVVMGNLEMTMAKLPQDGESFDNLNSAMQAAETAAQMSGLMITSLGQTSDKRELLDISDVCQRYLPMFQNVMPGNVVIETDLPSLGPVISANANQIKHVFANLINNALESIGDNKGIIHLKVETVAPAEIPTVRRRPVDWQPKDKVYACLEVRDAGCGINDEDIEELFDPFFTTKFTGRGMGLAVVLGIVKAHGGAITVESKPGCGSTFQVFFPVSAEEVLRQPDKVAQPEAVAGSGMVLLVEDEEKMRDMAKLMLTRLGFSVIEAKDGVEAVEIFRLYREKIHFVISDLTMPRMDGWETLTALRKINPGVPVILASGYDKAHVMSGDHPELPQAFLGKPYKIKGLSDAISEALNKT